MEPQILECLDLIDQINRLNENRLATGDVDTRNRIAAIYDALKPYADYSDDSWEEKTSLLQDSGLTSKGLKGWLNIARLLIAVKIVMSTLSEKPYLTEEAVDKLLNFINESGVTPPMKARALYSVALCVELDNPKLCYDCSMKAFNLDPKLATLYNSDYVYDRKKVNDSYLHSCPICDSKEATPVYCVQQLFIMDVKSTLAPAKLWMKCDMCNNLYAYNFPVSQMSVMNGHYVEDSALLNIEPRYALGQICSDMFNKIKELTSGDQYLEVGIGKGEMLASALEMGYDVDAVEICKTDAETISAVLGLDVQCCDFVEFKTDKRYDVIIMGDVIEHVSKPMEVLKKAYEYLTPNGVLWLSTPNYNSGFSRLMKLKDPMWNQANHFTYFSYESLLPILEKLGFEIKRYEISKRYNGSMELYLQK